MITIPAWMVWTLAVALGVPAVLLLAFLVYLGWHVLKEL